MLINIAGIHGEEGTGYEPPLNKGAFACSNCEYFSGGSCGNKSMMEKSQLPRIHGGRVKVDPSGCCEFIERVGKRASAKKWLARRKTDGKAE